MTKSVFTKAFTQQESIPSEGIARAVEIMQTGRLHRYNLAGDEDSEASMLEIEYAKWQEVDYCVACTSGGYAIALAMRVCGVKPGDKVLANAYTLAPVPGAIAAVGALPCDAAVRFEVSPLDDAAGAGDLVLETRREPTGGIVTAWREVWRMSMSDLRAASAAASASVGWVSVVAETLDAGEDHVLRWSGPGNATWGLRNVSTRYVVP